MSTLSERLATLRRQYASRLKPQFAAIADNHMAELRRAGDRALRLGNRAPSFVLKDQNGAEVYSAELLKRGPLVVSFFRGTWCPYCVEELKALAGSYDAFRELGADVVVVTPQSALAAQNYYSEHPVPFSVLVDSDARVAEAYGLAYTFPEDLKELYANVFLNDLSKINESGTWRLPIPGRFVVASDGAILDAQSDPDYRFRPDPRDTLAVIEGLRASATRS